jgi:HEAT repeat protein
MIEHLLALSWLFYSAASGLAYEELTKANIPAGVSAELKMLIERTFSADEQERAVAARKLGSIGDQAAPAIPFLIRLLIQEELVAGEPPWPERMRGGPSKMSDYSVGNVGSEALSRIGEPAVEPCLAALKGSTGAKRRALIYQLGHFEHPLAFDRVMLSLKDPDQDVVEAAVCALVHSTDPRVVEPLLRVMKHPSYYPRWLAIKHFESHRDSRVVRPLLEALTDEASSVREAAAESLGEQRDSRAVADLRQVLHNVHEEPCVRYAAARALGKIDDPQGLDCLLGVVNDRGAPQWLRSGAAEGIGHSRDSRGVDPLTAVLNNNADSARVRSACAKSLAEHGSSSVVPLLMQVAKSESENLEVRFWAAWGVVKLTGGAVDDPGIIAPIGDHYASDDGVEMNVVQKREALDLVAEHGKTKKVRIAARRIIGKKWGVPVDEPPPYLVFFAFYCIVGLCFWGFWYRENLRRRQFTLRSLFVLMTLIAIGLPLLVAGLELY